MAKKIQASEAKAPEAAQPEVGAQAPSDVSEEQGGAETHESEGAAGPDAEPPVDLQGDAPANEAELSPAQLRARKGGNPEGFQNHTVVVPGKPGV